MKYIVLISLFFYATFFSFAQKNRPETTQTLFKQGVTHHGFFVAPVIKFSSLDDELVFLPGIKAAWTINRTVSLGFEGYGLAPTISKEGILEDTKVRPLLGYGGFFIEPIIGSNKLIHVTVPISFGAGWGGYVEDWSENRRVNYNNRRDELVDDQIFWVIEPGVNAELNLASFFRLGLGASYRFTQDVDMINTSKDYFTGTNVSLSLKFGRF